MGTSSHLIKFSLPADMQRILSLHLQDVCVVSVIYKSKLGRSSVSIVNKVLDHDASNSWTTAKKDAVEAVLDPKKRLLMVECDLGYHDDVHSEIQNSSQDFSQMWDHIRFSHAKLLLFLLHVSHVVVCVSPGCSLDTSYIRCFRALESIRMKLQNALSDDFASLNVSRPWYSLGRLTCPRMLFIFHNRNSKVTGVKKLQHSLEDMLYRILRKTRIVTNSNSSSLFSIPSNQEFVHIMSPEESTTRVTFMLNLFNLHCRLEKPGNFESSRLQTDGQGIKEFLLQHVETALTSGFDETPRGSPTPEAVKLQEWCVVANRLYNLLIANKSDKQIENHRLSGVIHQLKGLMDVELRFSENRCQKVMQLAENAYLENLPKHYTESVHKSQLAKAQHILMSGGRGPALSRHLERLNAECTKHWLSGRMLCEAVSLSGNHCIHELHRLPEEPITSQNETLPCYSHSTRVRFTVACHCGATQTELDDPFSVKYANHTIYEEMAQGCCSGFKSIPFPTSSSASAGDQICKAAPTCEQDSCDELVESRIKRNLQSMGDESAEPLHSTNSLPVHVTVNGTTRELAVHDAAVHDAAVHDAAVQDAAVQDMALQGFSNEDEVDREHNSGKDEASGSRHILHPAMDRLRQEEDVASMSDHRSYYQSLSQGHHDGVGKVEDTTEDDAMVDSLCAQDTRNNELANGCLLHMLTNTSPKGLLPEYSSWALTCLGTYNSYNPAVGIEQPGFITGSNFLLPWEVIIKGLVKESNWPSVSETSQQKQQRNRKPVRKLVVDTTAKIYIGDEYECPQGHRFLCSGPEKVIKVNHTSNVKDNANKLLTMDMPLYFFCPSCNGIAQLRRIFISTPDNDSLVVSVLPRVQPAPPPCPLFLPSRDGAVQLAANSLWVVHLPHFYVDDVCIYPLPTDQQKMMACRMLKGAFHILNTSDPLS